MGLCAGSWISRSRPAAPPTLVKIYKAGAEAGAEAAAEARVSPRQKSWFRQLFECLEGGCGSARSQGGAPSSPLSTNSGLSPSEDDASWTPTLLRSISPNIYVPMPSLATYPTLIPVVLSIPLPDLPQNWTPIRLWRVALHSMGLSPSDRAETFMT